MDTPIEPAGGPDPYAPPRVDPVVHDPELAEAETIRRELLYHEVSVRSIGSLYILAAVLFALSAVTLVLGEQVGELQLAVGIVYLVLAVPFFLLGRAVRRLSPRTRIPVTILSVIGLLGIPLGTLLNGYILYLVHSGKGRRVMTPEYAAIIARTPHIRYRTSRIVLVAVAVLILLVLTLIGAALLA